MHVQTRSLIRMMRGGAVVAAALFLAAPAPARAQATLLDSLRPQVEDAVSRGDWTSVDAAAARLRAAAAGPGASDPWTQYDLGYVLHRRASAMLLGKQVDRAKESVDPRNLEALVRAAIQG